MEIVLFCCDGEQTTNPLRPDIVFPLVLAFKLYHPTRRCFQAKVPTLLSPLEQMPPRPWLDVSAHLQYHICNSKR